MKSEKLEILWKNTSGFNGLVPPRVPNRNIIDFNLFLWQTFQVLFFLSVVFPEIHSDCAFSHITQSLDVDSLMEREKEKPKSESRGQNKTTTLSFFCVSKKTCDKSKRLPGSPAGLPNRQTGSVLYQFLWKKKQTIGAVGVPRQRHRRDATQNRNKNKREATQKETVTFHLQN